MKQGQIPPFRRTRPVPIRREATGSFTHSRAEGAGFFPPFGFGSFFLRRGWDLNPRYPFGHAAFPRRCTRPLCDLSLSAARQINQIYHTLFFKFFQLKRASSALKIKPVIVTAI